VRLRWILKGILPLLFLTVCGCHSYQISMTVENRTGAEIRLLEVDYPSASFGTNSLAAGAEFPYRIVVRGDGPLKVQYSIGEGNQTQVKQMSGPTLKEHQEGRLEIVLLPGGKMEFHPDLTSHP